MPPRLPLFPFLLVRHYAAVHRSPSAALLLCFTPTRSERFRAYAPDIFRSFYAAGAIRRLWLFSLIFAERHADAIIFSMPVCPRACRRRYYACFRAMQRTPRAARGAHIRARHDCVESRHQAQ
jgi:hypothetical protein